MAEINVERRKHHPWMWLVAAVIALLVLWLLWRMFAHNETAVVPAADTAVVTAPATVDPNVAPVAVAPMPGADTAAAPLAGVYSSDNVRLVLNADGSYTISESPAGEGRGTWMRDETQNAVHLDPASGDPDRYFRIDSMDRLIPLNPNGQPAADMTALTRTDATAATTAEAETP